MSSRLREITMTKDKFIIRNMFGAKEIDHQAYKGLQEGIWPGILEIKFEERTYPFSVSQRTLLRGIFSLRSTEMLDQLTKEVQDHFQPESDREF